ncbi:hypothetical protein [Nitrosomonas sp. Is37]|uniref:hypothetical protein n=1 Tax=Nitrosomonas sp. Is37 TaxID=3080535 RepID=UPI00294AB604|nr:hypothetical protein [Nitrosomonas sp. Is37]MDV6344198.1 hypothetical protein [Nitrosomonas sp. Is37]
MEKLVLDLCLISPAQPLLCDAYRRILRLLERNRKSVDVVITRRGLNSLPEEADWTTVQSLADLNMNEREPDMYLCWDLPAINEVLGSTRRQPVVYGVTIDNILQGVLPVHPRIVGYLSDAPFLRGMLVGCGVPLDRQFSLAAEINTEDYPSPESAVSKLNSVLLISDDTAFSSTVAAACEVLGVGLERLQHAASVQEMPPKFYARYRCVIAAGRAALQAAAAGATVIVADERGSAGLLTQENLSRVLDAHAGPACFENSGGIETVLLALRDSLAVDTSGLAQQLCISHSETARARHFTVWLRQMRKNAEVVASSRDSNVGWPQLLNIAAMTAAATQWASTGLSAGVKKNFNFSSLLPSTEMLVECAMPVAVELASPPRLPFNQHIAANEEKTLTLFFGEGWSGGEPWGRWTDSSKATIQFETEVIDGSSELLLYLHTFLPLGCLFQRVVVSINGHPLLCWKLDHTTHKVPFRLPLNPEYLNGKNVYRIKFNLPDASSPQSWGKKDVRMLGIGLTGFELRRVLE